MLHRTQTNQARRALLPPPILFLILETMTLQSSGFYS
uniref:Uncharacterized protein n=1 Tax=Ciona intestinalis TaxID=7719 RepID=H2Y2C0_CIOIN